MKRDLRNTLPLCSALIVSAAISAIAPPARADAALDSFLAASADPQATLTLERGAADALARNDRDWFAKTALSVNRPLNRALSAIEIAKSAPAEAVKIGPCNYAWLALRSFIVRTSHDMAAVPKSAPLSEAASKESANIFAENMSRCELIKRLPRSKRLIGVDSSGL